MFRHTTQSGVTYVSTKAHQIDALSDIQTQCRADGQPVPTSLFQIHPAYREKTVSAGFRTIGLRAERGVSRDAVEGVA